ncbi:hypothetical protein [Clostridium tagluense]|nr:hypothetical protein [Clostridium tagluense]MCB2300356.1 hypothetical protein [Clostridium tagluense]
MICESGDLPNALGIVFAGKIIAVLVDINTMIDRMLLSVGIIFSINI